MLVAVTAFSILLMGLAALVAPAGLEALRSARLREAEAGAQALADAGVQAALARIEERDGGFDAPAPPAFLGSGTFSFTIRRRAPGAFDIEARGAVPFPPGREVRRVVRAGASVAGGKARLTRYRAAP